MKATRRSFTRAALSGAPLLAAQSGPETSDFPAPAGLTREVAEFIVKTSYADLPAEMIEVGKKSILDSIGLALAASAGKTARLAQRYIGSLGPGNAEAAVIGSTMKVPVRFAALLNGIGIHADDYDDTQLAVAPDRVYGLLTHPSASALPAALAMAEANRRPGRDFLAAYHVGVEVECKIAEAMSPRHYEHGFHSTGTVGTFGSAAAAAKIRGLRTSETARALSIAASSASGLRENFGTMTKPLHAGRAAENGVVAVQLAELGWTASEQILESPRGFYRAAAGTYNPSAIAGMLGKPWTFLSPGVSIKPHPSGSLTHPGMTELARLIRDNDVKPEQVERLDVAANRIIYNTLVHRRPQDHLQAKFSLEFCLACLLLYRRAGLAEFTDEVCARPEVRAMIERVHVRPDPEADRVGLNKMTTILTLRLKDGRVLHGRAEFAKGSPQNPMSYEEVAEKFRECAGFAGRPAARSAAIVETVRTLETLSDIRKLTALCAG